MMHFPSLFQISPLFSKNFQTLKKNFTILPFPETFLHFHQPKIFFLVIDHKFRISPYFLCFSTFSLCFAKIIISPYFYKFPPCFRQIHLLFTYFTCISFPPTLTVMHLCVVIVISKLLKRYSKAKRTRAPAYSRALRRIKGGIQRGSREVQVRFPEYQ